MKRTQLLAVVIFVLLIASCQSVAEKVSGTYTGTYSASGLPVSTGSGSLVLSPNGSKAVNMVFTSSGNPNISIQNVGITDIFGQYIFDLNDNLGGTIDVNGTIATGNILAMTYDNNADTISLSLAGFGKQ